jgi:hypothetical protein
MFRLIAGDDTKEASDTVFPTQFLDKSTAPDPATTKVWSLPGDYVAKFKAAWNVE